MSFPSSQSTKEKDKAAFFQDLFSLDVSDSEETTISIDGQVIDLAKLTSDLPKSSASPSFQPTVPSHKPVTSVLKKVKQIPGAKMPKRKELKNAPIKLHRNPIFQGLCFYFYPNDEVSSPRRARVQKARERGAEWIKEWNPSVITHVVIDLEIPGRDLLKYMKLDAFPDHIVVVNERYPGECMRFGRMIEPIYSRLLVEGLEDYDNKAREAKAESFRQAKQGLLELGRNGLSSTNMTEPERKSVNPEKEVTQQRPTSKNMEDEVEAATSQPVIGVQVPPSASSMHVEDALDEAIREVKDTQSLPADLNDRSFVSSLPTKDADNESSPRPFKRQKKTSPGSTKGFVCMTKNDRSFTDENPNKRTIEVLQKMYEYYERTNDHWRVLAYRKAISALKKQPEKIRTKEEAFKIPGIGGRIAEKIEEIVTTNRLQRLENTSFDEHDIAMQLFMGIYQVGRPTASMLIAKGHRTLEDLRKSNDLTPNQRIGLEHYDDFQQRIPREEVAEHARIVCDAMRQVEPKLQGIVGGSYRRGSPDSGDIDMVITMEGGSLEHIRTLFLESVIPKLWHQNFLKARLASGHGSESTASMWHGASAIPSSETWRRIDFLFVPWAEIGAALLYFTGNDVFNRSIRLLASKKGMRLNQYGLYEGVIRGPGRQRVNEGRLLESRDEKKIFGIPGVPWRPPEHRVC